VVFYVSNTVSQSDQALGGSECVMW
jgi:hypothetical protein